MGLHGQEPLQSDMPNVPPYCELAASKEGVVMTECIFIQAWVLFVVGLIWGIVGFYIMITDIRDDPNGAVQPWKLLVACPGMAAGVCAVLYGLSFYVVPYIAPMLPCVTVITP